MLDFIYAFWGRSYIAQYRFGISQTPFLFLFFANVIKYLIKITHEGFKCCFGIRAPKLEDKRFFLYHIPKMYASFTANNAISQLCLLSHYTYCSVILIVHRTMAVNKVLFRNWPSRFNCNLQLPTMQDMITFVHAYFQIDQVQLKMCQLHFFFFFKT